MSDFINAPFAIRSPQKQNTQYFLYENKSIPFTLKRSRRKTLSVKIDPAGEIVAHAPLFAPLFSIESFLQEKAHLILRHQEEVLQVLAQEEKNLPRYKSGDIFRLKGAKLTLRISSGAGKRAAVRIDGEDLIISSQDRLSKDQIRTALEKWYKQKAEDIFSERLNYCMELAKTIGVKTLPDMSIRNMKSRWGSCRMDQNKITLNLKLVQLNTHYIDSVIYHELCHFKVGAHNKSFYTLLEHINPLWKEDRVYLKKEYYIISSFLA